MRKSLQMLEGMDPSMQSRKENKVPECSQKHHIPALKGFSFVLIIMNNFEPFNFVKVSCNDDLITYVLTLRQMRCSAFFRMGNHYKSHFIREQVRLGSNAVHDSW